jgi:uncharacterized protein (DUF885 family)
VWGLLACLLVPAGPEAQSPSSVALGTIIDGLTQRGARGGARPDPAGLLTQLRAIDVKSLSFDERIDARFAETILIGRQVTTRPASSGGAAAPMGEAAYTRMLREQHLLPYDAEGLWTYAWQEFNRTVRELESLAKRIDPKKTWLDIANEVKQRHPAGSEMMEAHQEVVDRARAHLMAKDLMTVPWKERVNVVPRWPTPGSNPYYGSFSGASSRPPAEDGTFIGEMQLNPFDPTWDATKQRDYLLEHDWGVIQVTAPHETYGGHHVQLLYQMHNPRILRRQMSTPMFSEGWGLYNEQLFLETGFFPDETIQLRQLQLRLWRNARVVYDCGLQTGRMTRAEAVGLMVDRVGFLKWAAEAEVDSAINRPGYFFAYFVGMSEILKMREEYRTKLGARFTLKKFHDDLLAIGSMPPALMREALLR